MELAPPEILARQRDRSLLRASSAALQQEALRACKDGGAPPSMRRAADTPFESLHARRARERAARFIEASQQREAQVGSGVKEGEDKESQEREAHLSEEERDQLESVVGRLRRTNRDWAERDIGDAMTRAMRYARETVKGKTKK